MESVTGVTVLSVGGHLVTVEAFVGPGFPPLVFTGLPGSPGTMRATECVPQTRLGMP